MRYSTLGKLRDLGLTANAVHERAVAGRLRRVHRSVYSLGASPAAAELGAMAFGPHATPTDLALAKSVKAIDEVDCP